MAERRVAPPERTPDKKRLLPEAKDHSDVGLPLLRLIGNRGWSAAKEGIAICGQPLGGVRRGPGTAAVKKANMQSQVVELMGQSESRTTTNGTDAIEIQGSGMHRGPLRSAKQEYQPPYQEALSHREQGEHVLLNTRTKNRN